MPDITMCKGYKKDSNDVVCPMYQSCYRYKATPSEHRQSYFVDAPFINAANGKGAACEYFWKDDNENR